MRDKKNRKWLLVYGFFFAAAGIFLFERFNEGTLVLTSHPEKARVFLNDKDYGTTPLRVSLKNGEYRLVVTSEGYGSAEQVVAIESRQTTSLDIALPERKADKP